VGNDRRVGMSVFAHAALRQVEAREKLLDPIELATDT